LIARRPDRGERLTYSVSRRFAQGATDVAVRNRFIVLCVLLSGLVEVVSVGAQDAPNRIPASQIIRSTVRAFVVTCDTRQAPDGDPLGVPIFDTCQALGSGSGTIISQDGLILTNAHVALNEETGEPRWLLIALTTDARELPTAAFFSHAVIYDAKVDLAVVKPFYAMDGNPIQEGDVNLLPLQMAKNDQAVQLEQPVRLIGYPGVGGNSVTVDPAVVSGFGADENVPELGGSAWFKTDPAGGAGISGGSAVDDNGILVGVPSAAGAAEIRCVDANGDGQNDPATECTAMPGESGFSRPIPEAYGLLLTKAEESGQLDGSGNSNPQPTPETDTPEPPNDGVVITGRVVSADTGDPIEGAFVLVFQPGVNVKEALDRQDPADVYAYGQSDSRGEFILNIPVVRNQGYGVVVYAPGYSTIGGDDVVLATDADPATKNIGDLELAATQ
jgi:hypothetical protein